MLTIIVPTRNEAANIYPLLERLALAMEGIPFGVLFVDDSTDETPEAVSAAAGKFAFPVRLIARPPERRNGLSGAVVEGFQQADGEWLCVMDADLQHPPEVIPTLLARAQEAGADVVVGSRQATGWGPRGLNRRRALTSQLLTILARAWFPRLLKNVSDPLTGLFLVRRRALNVDALRPDGFKILLELLIRCPGLRVSEVHFNFAARHEGESKADFREGMRFFRHLLRLRATANQSFPRLIVVALGSVALDTAVLVALSYLWPYWLAAILSAELFILLRFAVTQTWVLGGGRTVPGWPSFRRFFISNQLSLFLARLPLLYLLISRWHLPTAAAGIVALILEGIIRYALSEQWVFSLRGIGMGPRSLYRYDLHGILGVESQVRLPELAYFETAAPLAHVDIGLRIDRQGTPSPQPGAIIYDERLSRFGFGVAIMPGSFTEVVVSPALEKAPYALYKSILEPVLRWAFAHKGAALVYGGCVAHDGRATLIIPTEDKGKTGAVLQAVTQGEAFLSDDFTILMADGRVFSYPKPITVTQEVLHQTAVTVTMKWPRQMEMWLRNRFYSPWGRRAGLAASRQHWPVATLNIYWQRLLAPPKVPVTRLLPQVQLSDRARLTAVMALAPGGGMTALPAKEAAAFIHARSQAAQGFPPYALLDERLADWQGTNSRAAAQTIIQQACHRLAHPHHYSLTSSLNTDLLNTDLLNTDLLNTDLLNTEH